MTLTKNELRDKKVLVAQILLNIMMVGACLLVILPLLLVLTTSFTDNVEVLTNGYSFFPSEWSLTAYQYLFSNNRILIAYCVSIFVTVLGTTISILVGSMLGFLLANKKVKHRNKIAFYLYLPTLLNAGLVPWYYNISKTLALDDTIWALIFPMLINAYNIFLFRNYFKTIPDSILEAAELDRASQFRIFFGIVFPLSKPIIATIALFVSISYWNDWYYALWFINNENLYPLQYFLYQIYSLISYYTQTGGSIGGEAPTETIMLAATFVTIGPIVLVYPFIQKYLVSGIMIGAVKG